MENIKNKDHLHTNIKSNYLLITLAKNEERYLPTMIESVLNSYLRPVLWLIINDTSSDDTLNIIKNYAEKYDFIKYISTDDSIKMTIAEGRFSYLANLGFDYMINYCTNHRMEWDYLALLDADVQIANNYYSGLIEQMEMNKKIGIASGVILEKNDDKLIVDKSIPNWPHGGMRLIRKKCLFDIKKYSGPSPDSSSNIKAKFLGWELKTYNNIICIHLRRHSSKNGLWSGYYLHGEGKYYYGYNLLLFYLNVLNMIFRNKIYLVIPFSAGYLSGYLGHKNKIDDKIILYYYRYIRLREIFSRRAIDY